MQAPRIELEILPRATSILANLVVRTVECTLSCVTSRPPGVDLCLSVKLHMGEMA